MRTSKMPKTRLDPALKGQACGAQEDQAIDSSESRDQIAAYVRFR